MDGFVNKRNKKIMSDLFSSEEHIAEIWEDSMVLNPSPGNGYLIKSSLKSLKSIQKSDET